MFAKDEDPATRPELVVNQIMDYNGTSEHSQHFLAGKCSAIGLHIDSLEADRQLQEHVLSVHHTFMASFDHRRP